MGGFELAIFPADAAALTVTTTVLVGVWIVAFCNLRFGWTLSGLVVPGYLVPLIISRPWAAGITVAEAIITYLIVIVISERPRFMPYWCSLFGRDRFFALVLVSVLVRAIGDGWVLPWLGQLADAQWGISIDYRNDLHSYGLIVVSLIANYFWKPGIKRGLLATGISCFATWLVTRYVLVGLTNFNIGELQFAYDDVAQSLLSSPKAYIIVITTAYLASLMNLRYSWEFNGILIPALLALLWHEPGRIVISIIESLVLLGVGSQLLKLKVFQRTTMEGARKLLFFFTLCYCMRLMLAHLLPVVWPDFRANEVFGFGYLLTTLMSIKAYDKKLAIRLIRGTLQVSFTGAIAASLIGFAMMKLSMSPGWLAAGVVDAAEGPRLVKKIDRPLSDVVRADKVLLYQMRAANRYKRPVNTELVAFRQSLDLVEEYRKDLSPIVLRQLAAMASRCNYSVSIIDGQYLYLRERMPVRGWGMYAFRLKCENNLCIEVPAPLDEWSTIEAGLLLLQRTNAATLAIAGADRQSNSDGSSDVLNNRSTIFSEFHRRFSNDDVIQLRGHTRTSLAATSKVTGQPADVNSVASQLWVSKSMPVSLRPSILRNLVPGFELLWQDSPLDNILRDTNAGGFAELRLSRADRRRLLGRLVVDHESNSPGHSIAAQQGHLSEWLLAARESITRQGSESYRPATIHEMLFLDLDVLTPLVTLIGSTASPAVVDGQPQCESATRQDLEVIRSAARSMGYELTLFHDVHHFEAFVILHEPAEMNDNKRCWGTFVFRWGLAEPCMVEVPRPLLERNVFEFGTALFARPKASVLSVAGAHPRANVDGSSDLIRLVNKVNLLNLVRQVMLRESGERPMLVQQVRAIQSPTTADVVIATDSGDASDAEVSLHKREVVDQLTADHLSVAFVDGSMDTAGYEVSNGLRAATVDSWQNKEVIALWLSPTARMSYRDHSENVALAAQCHECEIPTVKADLRTILQQSANSAQHLIGDKLKSGDGLRTSIEADLDQLTRLLLKYAKELDVVRLADARTRFDHLVWTQVVDRGSGQVFLTVADKDKLVRLVVRTSGRIVTNEPLLANLRNPLAKLLDRFVGSRATVLRFVAEDFNENP